MRSEKTPAGYVEWNKEQVKLHLRNGEGSEGLPLSNLWLRDSCPCHQCVDPDSGQKNFSTTDLHDRPKISNAKLQPDGSLKVIWASDRPSGGLAHTSIFSADEVAAWQAEDKWQRGRVAVHNAEKIYWDRAGYEALLADGRCRVSYKDWMNNEAAFWDAFADLRQTGLIFVTDVPSNEEEVERIATRIGPLQDTFYGRTWDVKSKPQAENVAYTSKFLGLHQDLMYHDPVPGLQLLHCISNTCEGGESLFSHGVRAAYELKLHQSQHYRDLTKLKSWFGYRKGDNHYFMSRHTIATDPQGNPTETRWAPPFQATFQITSSDKRAANLALWKKAATAFQSVVEAESNMVQIKLKAGECVIFDNRRVLHGRRQFTMGTGSRWLKGAYVTQQNYSAAATRLWEYLRELGMALPPQRLHWKEEQNVEASLEARRLASARFPSIKKFMQSEGLAELTAEVEDVKRTTDSVAGDVEIPELIPRPWAAHYTEPVQESEVAQNAEPAENAESAENAEPVEKAQPSEIVEPAEDVEPAPNAEPAPPKE
jgi:alpha-ketoglutarate-dependent taurine dioxygenase